MRTHLTWILALTMTVSPGISFGADTDQQEKVRLRNVELNQAGQLEGQVLTPQGTPVAGAKVVVRSQDDASQIGQQLVTDAKGRFVARGLKSGTCVVQADDQLFAVRVWTNGQAPPRSLKSIALVPSADETVRGQFGFPNRIRNMTRRQKIAVGLIAAGATALAVALAQDDDDDGS